MPGATRPGASPSKTETMLNIRWKKRYRTGDARLDDRNQALVALLADIHAELGRKEHCAEIRELYAQLAVLTKERLSKLSKHSGASVDAENAIGTLLKNEFPLATRSTPACKDCGLCDLVEDRVRGWLAEGDVG